MHRGAAAAHAAPPLPFDARFSPAAATSRDEQWQRERAAMALTHGADEALSRARAEWEARQAEMTAGRNVGAPDDPQFFRRPGEARPFLCRSPGCGESFGTLAAAVRHLKSAHTGVLPLFTSTETDAELKVVWQAAGLDAKGWVPSVRSEAQEKAEALARAARDRGTAKARWAADPLGGAAKRTASTAVRLF